MLRSDAKYVADALFNTPNGMHDGVYPPTNILATYSSAGSLSGTQTVDAPSAEGTTAPSVDPATMQDPTARQDQMDDTDSGPVQDDPMPSVEEQQQDNAMGNDGDGAAATSMATGAPMPDPNGP